MHSNESWTNTAARSANVSGELVTPNAAFDEIGDTTHVCAGQVTKGSPSALGRTWYGCPTLSFAGDFYNRIWVFPATVQFGVFSNDIVKQYSVWNAWLVQDRVLTYTTDDANGNLTLEDSNGTPFVQHDHLYLNLLEYRVFNVTALQAGDPTFTVIHTWTSGFEAPTVTLTGTRVLAIPWHPEEDIIETLEWLTQILTARDGSEQRIRLRQVPRQFYRIVYKLTSESAQSQYEAFINRQQKLTIGVPGWHEMTTLAAASLSAGDTAIAFTTDYADYRDSGLGFIWSSKTNYEVIQIDTVSSGSLSLETPLVNSYSGETYIMPLRAATCAGLAQRTDDGPESCRIEIVFRVTALAAISGYSPSQKHNDRPILLDLYMEPGGRQAETSDADLTFNDFQTGAFYGFSDNQFNLVTRNFHFVNDTRAKCWQFRQMLHALAGPWKTAYAPTYKHDLTLAANYNGVDTTFKIEQQTGIVEAWDEDPLRNAVAFVFSDETVIARNVTGVDSGAGFDTVSIDEALHVAVTTDDAVRICWLDKRRIANDSVEIRWRTPEYCESTLPLRMVTA